jgi:hypothetical protein
MEDLTKIVEELETENDRKAAADPLIKKSLGLVKEFMKTHRVLCYGGTAINNLLPPEYRFYDPDLVIPDYDFFSETPQEHAMALADQLAAIGIDSIEVKPGMHLGTYKVFANYEGVADITQMDSNLFARLWKEKVVVEGIHYVTPNFLRMSMYLELSRPRGDVSRWTKVYQRLQLLNDHYPLSCPNVGAPPKDRELDEAKREEVETILKKYPVVLLGITASQAIHEKKRPKWTAPVTLLAEPDVAEKIAGRAKTVERFEGDEVLPSHMDILDKDGKVFLRIHETNACHSYHEMKSGVRVASIPTMLQFVFAYMYADVAEAEITHLMCVSQRLVDLASKKEGRRFALLTPKNCIGKQETLVDMKKHKAELYTELSKDKSSADFLQYFFSYDPHASKTERNKVRNRLKATRNARSKL